MTEFTEFTEAEWHDGDDVGFEDGAEVDWDREADLQEVVGEKPVIEADGLEAQEEAELDSVIQGFRDRAGKEAQRNAEVTLADAYVCVCFATREQREAFMAAKGWLRVGRRYVDGRRIAALEGIDLPPDPEWPQTKRDRTWDDLAMSVEENRALPLE
jgi:hypothetical protein